MLQNHPKLKIAAYVAAGAFVICIIATGTVALLTGLKGNDEGREALTTVTDQRLDAAKKYQQQADAYKNAGDVEGATESYRKALASYQAAGEAGSASAIELEINYLESLDDPDAPNVPNDEMPSEDPADYSDEEREDDLIYR